MGKCDRTVHIREVLGSSPCSPTPTARVVENGYPCGLCLGPLLLPATTRAGANASRAVCIFHRIIGDADLTDQLCGAVRWLKLEWSTRLTSRLLTLCQSEQKPDGYNGPGHPVRAPLVAFGTPPAVIGIHTAIHG